MGNYQILEIILDAAFFATVAAILVIFTLIRERSLTSRVSDRSGSRSTRFPSVLQDASAGESSAGPAGYRSPAWARCEPAPAEQTVSSVSSFEEIGRKTNRHGMSRAEKELLHGIEAGRSRRSV